MGQDGQIAHPQGVIVVDKVEGLSSMDVVRRLRRGLTRAVGPPREKGAGKRWKVGHGGTLDPLATGVVVCCVGREATRLVERLMGLVKVYHTVIDLSAFTETDDREGGRRDVAVESAPDSAAIAAAIEQLTGTIEQVPPDYSAVHVDGQRAYQLARAGRAAAMEPRPVRIDRLEMLSYTWPELTLRITCGRGTYIRSIARDLGRKLGTGGHLLQLRREAVGPFRLEGAVSSERLAEGVSPLDLIGVDEASTMIESCKG